MKNILFGILFVFISCNEQNDTIIEQQIVGDELKKNGVSDLSSKPSPKHPIITELLTFESKNLSRIDALYRKSITECADLEYCDNLKQYGFKLVIKHGLLDEGTNEQKLFYVNEQLESTSNFPNFNEFYSLLKSLKKDISNDRLRKHAVDFYDKNLKLIEDIDWPTSESKNNKIIELKQNHKLFLRYNEI